MTMELDYAYIPVDVALQIKELNTQLRKNYLDFML